MVHYTTYIVYSAPLNGFAHRFGLFASLEREKRLELSERLQLQTFQPGEVFFPQGAEGTEVLVVLRVPDLTVDERRSRIEQIVYVQFDFETMSRLVLARNWKRFDPSQREAFIREFKRHLSRSYGTRLSRYEQEEVEVIGERKEKRGDVTVLTVIRGGQFDGAEHSLFVML